MEKNDLNAFPILSLSASAMGLLRPVLSEHEQPMAQRVAGRPIVVPVANSIEAVLQLMACPTCHAAFRMEAAALTCTGCGQSHAVTDRVIWFTRGEAWRTGPADETSLPYRERFMTDERATEYRRLYEARLSKRLTTRHEKGTLERLLATQGHCRSLLDIPCGNGRVSAPLAAATDLLIEGDTGPGQIRLGRRQAGWTTSTVWMTASVFEIPFHDGAVDGVVCNRLMHHLPSAEEQERLIAELLRVSRRFVILTFFDSRSVKHALSVVSGRRRRRHGLSAKTIDRLARAHGGRLAASPRLFLLGSGQRYALLVKTSGTGPTSCLTPGQGVPSSAGGILPQQEDISAPRTAQNSLGRLAADRL